MSKKSFNESREKNYLNNEGLKQRRLKEEHRWRFNRVNVELEDGDYEEYEDSQETKGSFH